MLIVIVQARLPCTCRSSERYLISIEAISGEINIAASIHNDSFIGRSDDEVVSLEVCHITGSHSSDEPFPIEGRTKRTQLCL